MDCGPQAPTSTTSHMSKAQKMGVSRPHGCCLLVRACSHALQRFSVVAHRLLSAVYLVHVWVVCFVREQKADEILPVRTYVQTKKIRTGKSGSLLIYE